MRREIRTEAAFNTAHFSSILAQADRWGYADAAESLLVIDPAEARARPKPGAAFLGTRPNISESHSEISTRVPLCIKLLSRPALTGALLNATGQSRATLSLQQEHLRAACGLRQEEKGPEIRPQNDVFSQAFIFQIMPDDTGNASLYVSSLAIQKGTRVLISLWDCEISTRVPPCIAGGSRSACQTTTSAS